MKSGRKTRGATGRARRSGLTRADIESFLALLDLASRPKGVVRVLPGTKLRLQFSDEERSLILGDLMSCGLTDRQLKALKKAKRPSLSMTLEYWEDFGGWVASAGNHARDGSRLQRRADALSDRIQELLDTYTGE